MHIAKWIAWAVLVALYVWFATLLDDKLVDVLPPLWTEFSFGVLLVPIAAVAGYRRIPWRVSLVAFWLVNLESFAVAMSTTAGESLYSGASEPTWVTAIINVIMFGTFGALLSVAPTALFFALGYGVRRRGSRGKR